MITAMETRTLARSRVVDVKVLDKILEQVSEKIRIQAEQGRRSTTVYLKYYVQDDMFRWLDRMLKDSANLMPFYDYLNSSLMSAGFHVKDEGFFFSKKGFYDKPFGQGIYYLGTVTIAW